MTRPVGAIVFDLDDTLYLERDYVLSGFRSVGRWMARTHGVKGFGEAALRRFEDGRRGDIFDAALADAGMTPVPALIAELVSRYRSHRPRIALAPDAARWLADRPAGWAVALITDGPVDSQAAKVKALGLDSLGFDPVILTDRWGAEFRKPHVRAFEAVQDRHALPGHRCIYVADNAAKDFVAPRRLGWTSVQIRRHGGLHQAPPASAGHAPDHVIGSLSELVPGDIGALV